MIDVDHEDEREGDKVGAWGQWMWEGNKNKYEMWDAK